MQDPLNKPIAPSLRGQTYQTERNKQNNNNLSKPLSYQLLPAPSSVGDCNIPCNSESEDLQDQPPRWHGCLCSGGLTCF